MGGRLDRALEYARAMEAERASQPKRQRRRGWDGWRTRQQGGHPLEETATLPAGTQLARTRANGHEEYRELDYDTVFPADCVGDDEAIIGNEDWLYERD